MPLFEEKKSTNQTDNCDFNNTGQPQNNQTNQKPQSGLLTIIGQLLPLAPFAFEQFTGQKIPQMTGTVAEMQSALINIQTNLQAIASSQQQLVQRLIAVETKLSETQASAIKYLTNLTHQFNSLRLTHTKEQKRIEIEHNPSENSEESY